MSKIIKEDCKSISIYKLKEWGYLIPNKWCRRNIYWINEEGERIGDINAEVDLRDPNNMVMRLDYKIRHYQGEWQNVKQTFNIVSTDCNYGGKRYWFECSLRKNGVYCMRRIAKLYLTPDYNFFGCRHCFDLTYEARNSGYTYTLWDYDKYEDCKYFYYKGKRTRRHKKYLKIARSADKFMNGILSRQIDKL